MTHEEILNSIKDNPTIGNYISMAAANTWTKWKIVRSLYDYILVSTGESLWNEIEALYDKYMEKFSKTTPEHIKPTDGFQSITQATENRGIDYRKYNHQRKNGVKVYFYDDERYLSKSSLLKETGMSNWDYEKAMNEGLIKTKRVKLNV